MTICISDDQLRCSGCGKTGEIRAGYSAWEKGSATFELEFEDHEFDYASIGEMEARKGESEIEFFYCGNCGKEWDSGEDLAADTVGVNLEHIPRPPEED